MNNVAIFGADAADALLRALGEQLASLGAAYELIVVGGSALLALGLVERPTKDVDVVALREGETIQSATPLPMDLVTASDRVARDFGLPTSWLNAGPADMVRFGLPERFLSHAEWRDYGSLTVFFAARLVQVLQVFGVEDAGLDP